MMLYCSIRLVGLIHSLFAWWLTTHFLSATCAHSLVLLSLSLSLSLTLSCSVCLCVSVAVWCPCLTFYVCSLHCALLAFLHKSTFYYPRDAMLARIIVIATCLSVRPSVTCRYCVKTKKASGMISSPSGSPKTLVFCCQILSPNSKGFPPNGGLKQGSV